MNPFKYGQVVSAEDFCPRPGLLKELVGFIKAGQNVVLQGERRVGKTSLIHEAFGKLKRHRLVYVDLLEIKTADDFGKRMIKAIVSAEQKDGMLETILKRLGQMRPTLSVDPFTGEPSVSLDPRITLEPDSIGAIIDLVGDKGDRRPVAVVFDEFQDIVNLPDVKAMLAVLRGKIQLQSKIACIFAGSVRSSLSEIFFDRDSPFFKSAAALDVGPLDPGEFVRFLKGKFTNAKRRIDEEIFEELFAMADAVPGDVQQRCGALWDITAPGVKVSAKNLPAALELIFSREAKGYETALVRITGQQQKCLTGLARLGGRSPLAASFLEGTGITLPASVKKALTRLVRLKIVFRHQGEYRFVNPFFKLWLLWKNY